MSPPEFEYCDNCGGTGRIEVVVYRHQNFTRDVGYMDTELRECQRCAGVGMVEIEADD